MSGCGPDMFRKLATFAAAGLFLAGSLVAKVTGL